MLNETSRSLTSERIADGRPAAPEGPLSLTCASCGGKVELPFWQPQARCPFCNALGFPDRALRNLLPLGWTCPACGAANDGRTNFCLSCGAGLATRCHRCEAPVYGSVCMQCGEHQARPRQLQKSQSERVEWLPVQRERIEKQVAHLRSLEDNPAPAEPTLPPRPAPVTRKEARQQAKADRRARKQSGGGPNLFMILMVFGGLYLLVRDSGPVVSGVGSPVAAPTLSGTWSAFQSWLGGIAPSLAHLATLKQDDPQYAYLFAIVLVGVIALPFGLFLIDRLIKRIFP